MSSNHPTVLTSQLASQVNSQVRSRGRNYADDGAVEISEGSDCLVDADVFGSQAYQVLLQYVEAEESLYGDCTCPYIADRGEICKHIWATLVVAEQQGYLRSAVDVGCEFLIAGDSSCLGDGLSIGLDALPDLPWKQGVDPQEAMDVLAKLGVSIHSGGGGGQPGSGSQRATKRSTRKKAKSVAKPAVPLWQQMLGKVRENYEQQQRSTTPMYRDDEWPAHRELLYVIDPQATLHKGRGFAVEFKRRERKQNGEWGKLKSASLREGQVPFLPDETDRRINELLKGADPQTSGSYYSNHGYGYGGIDGYTLTPALQRNVLPLMCSTGRCMVVDADDPSTLSPLTWDDAPAWRFELIVNPRTNKQNTQQTQGYQLTGHLVRGEDQLPLHQPRLFTDAGVMFYDQTVARVNFGGAFPWLKVLRENGTVDIEADDAWAFIEGMLSMPFDAPLRLPDALSVERISGAPRPRLRIARPDETWYTKGRLVAHRSFEYDGQVVAAADARVALFDRERKRLITRDNDAEVAAEQTLVRLGLRGMIPSDRLSDDYPDAMALPGKRLDAVVSQLITEDWHVEADGSVYRNAGEIKIEVTSGIDWFELHGDAQFGDQTASLPELLQALRKGESTVRLGDGSVGMLPEQWLAKYAPLVSMGEQHDDHVRFKPTQTALLDALLAAMPDADCDAVFAKARQRLQNFKGVKAKSPVKSFDGELRDYQREGLGWLGFLNQFGFGGCLADDMGLGKTVQVLALLESRRLKQRRTKNAERPTPPSLAVVPNSLVWNWIAEAKRFTPQLRVHAHVGLTRERQADGFAEQLAANDLMVTTYGTLRRDIPMLKDISFDYVILDEAQAIKNPSTASAKAARLLQADHRLVMTGTPVENHLNDLWSLFEFLNPGMLGSAKVFSNLVTKAPAKHGSQKDSDTNIVRRIHSAADLHSEAGDQSGNQDGDQDGDQGGAAKDDVKGNGDGTALLSRALRPFILRRTKQQVATDLPDKLEQTLWCELQGKQRKQYDELREHYRQSLLKTVETKGLAKSKIHVLEALLRLRQAACHPALIDKKHSKHSSAKLDLLLDQLDEVVDEGHKALVFSQFTSMLSLVRTQLDERKVNYEYLDGKTRKRNEKVERFQNDDDCKVFLISLKAGGVGLNLTAADYVFLLDPWWNPAVEAQAIDRTHRIGQTQQVFAYRLIARGTVEEKVLELQQSKRELADAIINADNNSVIRNLSRDDLDMLLS